MRGLCCLGVVHAAVCWGRLRSAGGTNAAPTTCAMVFLRGGCEARHQRPPCRRGRTGRGQSGLGSWLWALERSAAPVCALLRAFLFYSYQTSSKKLLADDGVWTSRRSRRTAAWPLGTSRGAAQPSAPGPGARSTRPATSSSRTRRPRRPVPRAPALYARMRAAPRVDASDATRVAHPPRRLRRGRGRGRGRRARALDAVLALVAKRLGPDDTARAKRYWTRSTSRRARACC